MSTPTEPLPQSALDAMHRLERLVAGMGNGESADFNGVTVTAVSLEVADAITMYKAAAARAAKLARKAVSDEEPPLSDLDADSLAHAEDLMAGSRATLSRAGCLDLIGRA